MGGVFCFVSISSDFYSPLAMTAFCTTGGHNRKGSSHLSSPGSCIYYVNKSGFLSRGWMCAALPSAAPHLYLSRSALSPRTLSITLSATEEHKKNARTFDLLSRDSKEAAEDGLPSSGTRQSPDQPLLLLFYYSSSTSSTAACCCSRSERSGRIILCIITTPGYHDAYISTAAHGLYYDDKIVVLISNII